MAGPTVLDESKVNLATQRVAGTMFAANNITVHLFEGSSTPDHTDDQASLAAIETAFGGYSPQSIGAWGTPVLNALFQAITIGSTVTFLNTSGSDSNPLTGWWYEDTFQAKAILVAKFATPIIIPAGQSFTFTPTWTDTGANLTT